MMEDIFGMEEGQLKLMLRGLLSLMDEDGERLNKRAISYHDSESYVVPHFAHASFRDYLADSGRSGPFHVNLLEYEDQVTKQSFALIVQLIRSRT